MDLQKNTAKLDQYKARARAMVARMSLEEKVFQMLHEAPAIPRLGVRFVQGMQGHDPDYLKTAACAKHFAVHSGPESLRHEFDAVVSKQDMFETYLSAFRALVQEAGVEAVMGAYNCVNGEPCSGSKTLLKDILRDSWGFDGHVVSDCWAVRDFHEGHHVTANAAESAALAVSSGCDVNCGTSFAHLLQAVGMGKIGEEAIDRACSGSSPPG